LPSRESQGQFGDIYHERVITVLISDSHQLKQCFDDFPLLLTQREIAKGMPGVKPRIVKDRNGISSSNTEHS